MKAICKELNTNKIKCVVGGDCYCECHHPINCWNHDQSKKGMSPNHDYCHNVLCSDTRWDNSTCTDIIVPKFSPDFRALYRNPRLGTLSSN